MDQGTWFVMFSDSAANLDAAAEFLRSADDWEVTLREKESMDRLWRWVEVLQEGQMVAVGLNEIPSVLEESREIAEQFGVGRVDQSRIASCDRRFEISFELRPDMDNFNLVLSVHDALQKMLGGTGVTFMANVGQLLPS